jgi:uncharacterized membrane protein YeiH
VSHVPIIVASILVFGFCGWVFAVKFREQATGAKRLAFITSLAGGCALGAQGVGESPVVHAIAWSIVATLTALTAYAKWRERARERLTRGSTI